MGANVDRLQTYRLLRAGVRGREIAHKEIAERLIRNSQRAKSVAWIEAQHRIDVG